MQCGNVMGFWSVMKHEEYNHQGLFRYENWPLLPSCSFFPYQADTSNFPAVFHIETLLSRYFGPLKAMLESRLPFLCKVGTQLDHKLGMKPQAPGGAMSGSESDWATFDVP